MSRVVDDIMEPIVVPPTIPIQYREVQTLEHHRATDYKDEWIITSYKYVLSIL
jgi:hypothetical protein